MKQRSRAIELALGFAAVVVLMLNLMFSQLAFRGEALRMSEGSFREISLPSASLLSTVFLDHSTFAADLAWIALNVNLGAARMAHRRPVRLSKNARVVQQLDPRFYRLYEWFPAVWVFSHSPLTFDDVEEATEFVRLGMDVYPSDTQLPFAAAMSYVGLEDPDESARVRRYRRIVDLLERATSGDNVHPDNPFILAYHRRRLREMESGLPPSEQDEREFYVYLYSRTPDAEIKRRLAVRLRALTGTSESLELLFKSEARLEELQRASLPYVPAAMFVFITEEN